MQKTTFLIPGIHSETCKVLIQDIGLEFPEIHGTKVDLENTTVTIQHDEELDLDQWKEEIEALGEEYAVEEIVED